METIPAKELNAATEAVIGMRPSMLRYALFYRAAWEMMDFIEEKTARVSAVNGMMVWADKNALVKPTPAERRVMEDSMMRQAQQAPQAEQPKQGEPRSPPAPAAPTIPTSEAPAKPQAPTPSDETQQPTEAPPKEPHQATVNGFDVGPEDVAKAKLPPYDKDNLHWNYCPVHPGVQINHESMRAKKPYQACFTCGVYLNTDGKKVSMKPTKEPKP